MGNKETSNFINKIICDWVGKELGDDPVDAYVSQYPQKCAVVDIYPHVIKDPEKYYQVSVFYQKWLDKKISGESFLACEKQFIEFLKTVWLYNRTDMSYCLSFDRRFKREYRRRKPNNRYLPVKCYKMNAENWLIVEEVSSLALREAGFLWMYFQEWEIIAVVHDLCIQLLTKNPEVFQLIDPILVNNRLYRRTHTNIDNSSVNRGQ